MFEVLFGNKNVEKILIFLFVNGKCYGTQLHRLFNTPLTPIQKVLGRLEKGGLIMSYYEGKTRIYRFNPGFPLKEELEQLLKKAYTLLSAHEKKNFYTAEAQGSVENKLSTLLAFWEKLASVSRLTFNANSKSSQDLGWNGRGSGEVEIVKNGFSSLIFNEKGLWTGKTSKDMNFSNIFRWTLDRSAGLIALEHLRRGPDHPVFLFHLAPSSHYSLSSVNSHLCGGDTYFGKVHFDQYGLRLNWRVIGPKKNEEIDYFYS